MSWRYDFIAPNSTLLKTLLRQLQINKCIIIIGALLIALPCGAEQFDDPTRPPAAAAAPVAAGDVQPQVNVGPVLQSVTMSKRRRHATISGQEVAIGGKFGEAVLVKISDSEVTLRNPDGALEKLQMFPQVEKKVIVPKEPKARAVGRN
jgi:MSHA biogenesis protein MshK